MRVANTKHDAASRESCPCRRPLPRSNPRHAERVGVKFLRDVNAESTLEKGGILYQYNSSPGHRRAYATHTHTSFFLLFSFYSYCMYNYKQYLLSTINIMLSLSSFVPILLMIRFINGVSCVKRITKSAIFESKSLSKHTRLAKYFLSRHEPKERVRDKSSECLSA